LSSDRNTGRGPRRAVGREVEVGEVGEVRRGRRTVPVRLLLLKSRRVRDWRAPRGAGREALRALEERLRWERMEKRASVAGRAPWSRLAARSR